MSATVQDGEDTYAVEELPENPDAEKTDTYSCVFGMTQKVERINTDDIQLSDSTQIFYRGEEGMQMDQSGNLFGYITEGTNDASKGQVGTEGGKALQPSDDMQSWLQGKEASTTSNLWTHFRKSAQHPEDNRNPWQACVNNGKCAIAGSS